MNIQLSPEEQERLIDERAMEEAERKKLQREADERILKGFETNREAAKKEVSDVLDRLAIVAGKIKAKRAATGNPGQIRTFQEKQKLEADVSGMIDEYKQIKAELIPKLRGAGKQGGDDFPGMVRSYLGEIEGMIGYKETEVMI